MRRLVHRPSAGGRTLNSVAAPMRGGASVASASPSLRPIPWRTWSAEGQPLARPVRAHFENRFGCDLSDVRVHDHAAAARSAEQVHASAFSVGSEVVLRDRSQETLAHELAHVVQWKNGGARRPPEAPEAGQLDDPAEREADAIASRAGSSGPLRVTAASAPVLRRKIDLTSFRVPLGELTFKSEPTQPPSGTPRQNIVDITFMPDEKAPKSDSIKFAQIVRTRFEGGLTWSQVKPQDKDLEKLHTSAGSRTHVTKAGDTLAAISLQHFGTRDRYREVFDANVRVLLPHVAIDMPASALGLDSAQGETVSGPAPDSPLPAGLTLALPAAVEKDFHLDVKPSIVQPRAKTSDPNVSSIYPFTKDVGENKDGGQRKKATMEDWPGAALFSARFEFETVPLDETKGIAYGALHWGFYYSQMSISQEYVRAAPNPTDTFRSAFAELNRATKNEHIAQKGETLRSIAELYFGMLPQGHAGLDKLVGATPAPDRIAEIRKLNPALASMSADAEIAPGTKLKIPGIGP